MKTQYGSDYFICHGYGSDPKRAAMYAQEVSRLSKLFPDKMRGGKILDVGCGLGLWYSHLRGEWQKYGVEPDEYAANCARENGVTIGGYEHEANSFDVIVFRGTIQHIDFPFRALHECTRILKPGGLMVFLATPNTNSIVYKLFGTLPALDPPRNWMLVSDAQMIQILTNLGYKDIHVNYPYLGTPYANPLKDMLLFFVSLFCGYRKFAFPRNMMEIYVVKG